MIHAVGPVWRGGAHGEADLLARCYNRALELAAAHGLQSVAFPCISTGAYGFPAESAARIAVATVDDALKQYPSIEHVIFCCYLPSDREIYARLL